MEKIASFALLMFSSALFHFARSLIRCGRASATQSQLAFRPFWVKYELIVDYIQMPICMCVSVWNIRWNWLLLRWPARSINICTGVWIVFFSRWFVLYSSKQYDYRVAKYRENLQPFFSPSSSFVAPRVFAVPLVNSFHFGLCVSLYSQWIFCSVTRHLRNLPSVALCDETCAQVSRLNLWLWSVI